MLIINKACSHGSLHWNYRQTSIISHTLVRNKIDHSDVVGASPTPTTSPLST